MSRQQPRHLLDAAVGERREDREVDLVTSLERDMTPARLVATSGMAWRLMTQLAVDRLLPEDGTPVERAMRYLEDRIDGHVRVGELAAFVGVSPSHLAALFRQATAGASSPTTCR
ncbi:hypothetical protein [Microbacterium aurantiacum]|uniref:hypothetical protein n=1 Tax=Microbacterium aurantiacum TaxID=162393 RepID=UPI003D721BE3